MPKEWDDSMKRLVRENPQHFVSWILPGAVFKRAMSLELKNRTRQTDYLQAKTIAGLVFQGEAEHEWIERKFAVYKDIIKLNRSFYRLMHLFSVTMSW